MDDDQGILDLLTAYLRREGYGARRSRLRAELDAICAHLRGLTRHELGCILGAFPIVWRKHEARSGEYRTKRIALKYECLEGWFG